MVIRNTSSGYLLVTYRYFLIRKTVIELCVRTVKNSRVFYVKNSFGVTSNLQTISRFRALPHGVLYGCCLHRTAPCLLLLVTLLFACACPVEPRRWRLHLCASLFTRLIVTVETKQSMYCYILLLPSFSWPRILKYSVPSSRARYLLCRTRQMPRTRGAGDGRESNNEVKVRYVSPWGSPIQGRLIIDLILSLRTRTLLGSRDRDQGIGGEKGDSRLAFWGWG